jgi:hypothetical protein
VVDVKYVELLSPAPVAAVFTPVFKSGTVIDILGTATGPSFRNFRVEWATGRDPASGWSTSGISLTGAGSAPISQGVVARFSPKASQRGEVTLRLTVQNNGFASSRSAVMYLEPDLVSSAWPRFLEYVDYRAPAVPARTADGATRLLRCQSPGQGRTAQCQSFTMDGTAATTELVEGSEFPVSVGRLDPAGGTQAVLADWDRLRIVAANLAPIRDIMPATPGSFACDQVVLADLDNDGIDEILAVKRDDIGLGWCAWLGELDVYRADGTLYSSNYPITSHFSDGTSSAALVAVDLDGDGRKEIVVTTVDKNWTTATTEAFFADGTRYAQWPTGAYPTQGDAAMRAADLDKDGHPEIVVGYPADSSLIRVFSSTGALRPGWPADGWPEAIADFDSDGQDEILIVNNAVRLAAIRADGTVVDTLVWPDQSPYGSPVVADIDDDGRPEILMALDDGPGYTELHSFRPSDGAQVRQWPYFGLLGNQPSGGFPTVADFNNDGKTDVALLYSLVDGGGSSGWIIHGGLSVYTTGARFSEANAAWPILGMNPQNNQSKPAGPAVTRVNPTADTAVCSSGASLGPTMLTVRMDPASGAECASYVRFPLTVAAGKVLSAKLRAYGSRPAQSTGLDAAYAVPGSGRDFNEATLTWNTRPALGAMQGQGVAPSSVWQYWEWDVTAFAASQVAARAPAIGFAVTAASKTVAINDSFHAREVGWSQPQLVLDVDRPPTVATPAAASPVVDNATTLSALGTDDRGESGLTYTWAVASGPASVGFSANGRNAAKTTNVTFTKAGTYTFVVTMKDTQGQTVTSTVSVTVTCILPAPAWTFAGPKVFDGSTSYVDGGKTPGSAATLTVAFSMTPDTLKNQIPVDKEPASGTAGWTVKLRSNGDLWLRIGSNANKTDVVLAKAYGAKKKIHVACTFGDRTAKIYINGILKGTQSGIGQSVQATSTNLRLAIPSVVATGEKYAGVLEKVRVYHSVLSDAQVKALASQ